MNEHVEFTGLLDRNCHKIYYGDVLYTGMRRNDPNGWDAAVVVKGADGLPCLENKDGKGQMQWDQELRLLIVG